jgi:hypothetical protein
MAMKYDVPVELAGGTQSLKNVRNVKVKTLMLLKQ